MPAIIATILGAEQITCASVRVRGGLLDDAPDGAVFPADNRGAVWDALYDRGWQLSAPYRPGLLVPRVVWVEPDPAIINAVILSLDAELPGPGEQYVVTGSLSVFAADQRAATFDTFGPARNARASQRSSARSFDLANVQTGGEGPGEEVALGTLAIDADGDYTNDAGIANLKKRILRRLTTPLGAFAHLPDYGMRLAVKGRVTAGTLRDLQAQALRQVRLELGVTDVRVAVSTPAQGVVLLEVEVHARGISFGVPVTLPLG